MDAGESYAGLNCLAAPIMNEKGEVIAALNIMAQESQMPKDEFFESFEEYIRQKALFVSRQLGYLYAAA